MKKGKRLLILLGMVVVFGVGAYLLNLSANQQEAVKDATPDNETTSLLSISADDAAQLSYSRGTDTIAFAKLNDAWVYAPRNTFALDTTKVDTMITDLANVESVRTVSDTEDNPSEYGLETPTMTITVTDRSGATQTLSIGDKNATNGNYYAKADGKPGIYTISSDLYNAFDLSLMQLLTDETYPIIDENSVTAIDWSDGQTPISLTYSPEGIPNVYSSLFKWSAAGQDGAATAINDDAVSTFLTTAAGITYESVAADTKDDLATYGLDQPKLSVTLHYTEDVPQSQVEAAIAQEAAVATVTPDVTTTSTDTATQSPTPAPKSGLSTAMAEDASAVPTQTATAEPTATPEPTVTVERSITLWLGNLDSNGNVYFTHSKTNRIFVVSIDTMTALLKLSQSDLRVNRPANLTLADITGMDATLNGVSRVITSAQVSGTGSNGEATLATTYLVGGQPLKTTLFSFFINSLKAIEAESYTDQPVATNAIPVFSASFTQSRKGYENVSLAIYPYDTSFDQAVINGDSTMLVNKRDVEDLQTYFNQLVATEATTTPEVTATPAPTAE